MNKFTKQEDEKLAESVLIYPSLCNPLHNDYKDWDIKEAIWAEVSKSVVSGKELMLLLKTVYNYNKNILKL
jgi:hypothetical protein